MTTLPKNNDYPCDISGGLAINCMMAKLSDTEFREYCAKAVKSMEDCRAALAAKNGAKITPAAAQLTRVDVIQVVPLSKSLNLCSNPSCP
jgi:hypothetical protein